MLRDVTAMPGGSGISRRTAADLLLRYDGSVLLSAAGLPPDRWQRRLLVKRSHRALVLTSRQVGKSTTVAARALQRAMTQPMCTVICVAPTERQSMEIITKVRRLIGSQPTLDKIPNNAATKVTLPNGSRIIALPGKPDTIRGYSADLLILDEAAFLSDDVYEVATPMTAATGGDIIALTTANGKTGWFYEAWAGENDDGDEWDRTLVPYTDVSRITEKFIRGEKGRMSPARFRAEYLCDFISPAGAVWNADMIARIVSEDIDGDSSALPDFHAWKREREAAMA